VAEGHSIVRWARALRALVGEPLELVETPQRWAERAAALRGERLTAIGTHGKHLLLHSSIDLTIHCHAMMYGSWQFGAPGMGLRKPAKQVRLRLRTGRREAVFFNGPVVEFLTAAELAGHDKLAALGPDLLHDDFDRDDTWRRLQRHRRRALGEALLDQRIVAGVGNIFKSEGLFVAGLDPRSPVGLVARDSIERLWDLLIPMMASNARRSGPILTLHGSLRRGGERYWVYRRRGKPCFRCGTPIEMLRQGQLKRTTYFCPSCQDAATLRRTAAG
jgi:DNA-formamidopyrimidine glycosylase